MDNRNNQQYNHPHEGQTNTPPQQTNGEGQGTFFQQLFHGFTNLFQQQRSVHIDNSITGQYDGMAYDSSRDPEHFVRGGIPGRVRSDHHNFGTDHNDHYSHNRSNRYQPPGSEFQSQRTTLPYTQQSSHRDPRDIPSYRPLPDAPQRENTYNTCDGSLVKVDNGDYITVNGKPLKSTDNGSHTTQN